MSTAWTGNGPTPDFTLTDDEVLALIASTEVTQRALDRPTLLAALSARQRMEARAEDILNEQRAARR